MFNFLKNNSKIEELIKYDPNKTYRIKDGMRMVGEIPDGTTHYGGFGCYYRNTPSGWKVLQAVNRPYKWESAKSDEVIHFTNENCIVEDFR
jgi:hypothetical protein